MSVAVPEQCAPSASVAPGSLFVATSLHVWFTGEPDRFARDFQINDTVYRRLDPDYYAWLRSRMVLARKAATARQLDAAAFEELRARFNAMHEWAVERFGEDELGFFRVNLRLLGVYQHVAGFVGELENGASDFIVKWFPVCLRFSISSGSFHFLIDLGLAPAAGGS